MTKQELSKMTSGQLIDRFGNKSRAIRALDEQGFSRSEISKLLSIRYQHVRNVLITPLTSKVIKTDESVE